MNSADPLPSEDRAEFERILDEALRTARLTTGADTDELARLREAAVDALPRIASAAATEYERLARARLGPRPEPGDRGRREVTGASSGAGLVTAFFALVPVLAAIAAVVFLLMGYALGLAEPEPAMAEPMRNVGWVFAVVAALGLLVAAGGLLVAAVRNGATSIRASAPADQLARAHEEWRRALYERGIAPFLRERAGRHRPGRTPRLRFSSPRFTSPDFSSRATGGSVPRPRYGQPEFASPEFTSPHFTSPADDEEDEAARERPGFGHPDFSSPNFTSPAEGGDRD
ncbi:hypothetical protein [Streptomyces litchfieldiae]|uniref:Transmembrane protein n=1 Tax=Streptomyces litchfieldiae TaxID=3075543 RepID=A0ABU2MN64_9ACTN|nr:hypothetical protein [Streptomyces sp. DSM 44938]MDT0342099.1 hypothetical protein [Streptomyces sp. DSM 44938]